MGSSQLPVKVFGTVVDDDTMKKQFPNMKVINAADKSYFAFKLKEAVKEDKNALDSEQNLKNQHGHGDMACTLFRIYNATGNTIKLLKPPFDFHGHVIGAAFPEKIENGQLAVACHKGSTGIFIYEGKNHKGEAHAWLHAWKNEDDDRRCVFTDILNRDHFDDDNWTSVLDSITHENEHHADKNRCYSQAFMGKDKDNTHIYIYDGIMTLKWHFPELT